MIRLEIAGFRVHPYVRMTQRGKYVDREAIEYRGLKDALAHSLRAEMRECGYEMFGRRPLRVHIWLTTERGLHRCDVDNLEKAILDACKGIVFEDDRWIDDLHITRELGDTELIELGVEEIR